MINNCCCRKRRPKRDARWSSPTTLQTVNKRNIENSHPRRGVNLTPAHQDMRSIKAVFSFQLSVFSYGSLRSESYSPYGHPCGGMPGGHPLRTVQTVNKRNIENSHPRRGVNLTPVHQDMRSIKKPSPQGKALIATVNFKFQIVFNC